MQVKISYLCPRLETNVPKSLNGINTCAFSSILTEYAFDRPALRHHPKLPGYAIHEIMAGSEIDGVLHSAPMTRCQGAPTCPCSKVSMVQEPVYRLSHRKTGPIEMDGKYSGILQKNLRILRPAQKKKEEALLPHNRYGEMITSFL